MLQRLDLSPLLFLSEVRKTQRYRPHNTENFFSPRQLTVSIRSVTSNTLPETFKVELSNILTTTHTGGEGFERQ